MPALNNDDRFKVEYKEVGDYIRHYSAVRSALTTFLLTVGVAAFSAYYHKQQTSFFFIVAAHLFLVVSIVVCLVFSYRTEHANLYQSVLWRWAEDTSQNYPAGFKSYQPTESVWSRVFRDPMNWSLVLVVLGVFLSFWVVTATDADHFARAMVAVLALFSCVGTVAIFLIVSESRQFMWAALTSLGLNAVPAAVAYFLLGK